MRACLPDCRSILTGLLYLVPALSTAFAVADEAGATVLTMDQAIARAETSSGLVRRARAERMAVEAREVGASALLPANPVVAVGLGPRREQQEGTPTQRGLQYAIHAEQMVEVANQRGTRRAEVARAVAVASARETLAVAETRARVRAVYIGAQLAASQLRSARSREALAGTLFQSVQTRVQTGAASDVELELARLEQGRATRDRISAGLAVEVALSDLRVLVALPPGAALDLTSPLASPPATASLAALVEQATRSRAELRILSASQLALDAAVVRLRREVLPNPTVFLDVQRDLPGQLYVGGGVALSLPTWRRNQGDLALVRAEQSRLQEEEAITVREVAADVERAYRAALAQAEAVAVVEQQVLPAAEAQVALVTEGWRAGKFDLFRVIQASREASDARRSLLETLGALWEARIALDRAAGTP